MHQLIIALGSDQAIVHLAIDGIRGLNQANLLGRVFSGIVNHSLRNVGVRPFALDYIERSVQLAIDCIRHPVGAFVETDMIGGHSRVTYRRQSITGLYQHHRGADRKVKQELAHRQVKA